jgi:hypothetical protein
MKWNIRPLLVERFNERKKEIRFTPSPWRLTLVLLFRHL